ncbi:hypothetical protein GCM10029976_041760 [Kribbella albertanoniae]|uniref:LPXTG cell wall anchor domain-containing protein n=1 Tax=Kribbella albertanoniae TaxID=1266829 RepID=A0A4R4QAV2_9ACTN|nr:hypothetical protein [Kribbella albertanoniae]TDC32478.1 hypothetical protein E1261_08295 [Kribbella albertanoniae]
MSYLSRRLAAAVLIIVLSGCFLSAGVAAAAPTPTPTVTATPNSPQDADPDDYNQAPWVVIAVGAVAVIIGVGTFWLVRSRRIDLSPEDDQ